MIIVRGNGLGKVKFRSDLGQCCLHFTLCLYPLGKAWIHLPSLAMSEIIKQNGLFNRSIVTDIEAGKL